MNFSFYIFGTPNEYNQYPADNNSTVFQEFLQNKTTESQLTIKRSGQLVFYVYMRQLHENPSSFLGFCLVFNGVYCHNSKKLFELFDRAYFDVQLKGELLRFDKGKSNFVISKFAEKLHEIEHIKTFFKNNIEHEFIHDFTSLSPSFKFGNGNVTISITENDVDILSTISEYEVVHISNNEKSLLNIKKEEEELEKQKVKKIERELRDEQQKRRKSEENSQKFKKRLSYAGVAIAAILVIGFVITRFFAADPPPIISDPNAIKFGGTTETVPQTISVSEKNRLLKEKITCTLNIINDSLKRINPTDKAWAKLHNDSERLELIINLSSGDYENDLNDLNKFKIQLYDCNKK